MLAAFTATNGRTGFFAIGFRFRMLIAFATCTRCFCRASTTTAAFNFTVVFIFSLTGMLRRGDVVVSVIALGWFYFPVACFLLGQFACFFSNTARIFFQLTAGFFFHFTLQLCGFGFTAGFIRLAGPGHIVGLLVAHFLIFRCFALSLFRGLAFGLLFGFTLRFFRCFAPGFLFRLTTSLFFRFTLRLRFCLSFSFFSLSILFYIGALFADFDLHRLTFTPGARNIQGTARFTLQR